MLPTVQLSSKSSCWVAKLFSCSMPLLLLRSLFLLCVWCSECDSVELCAEYDSSCMWHWRQSLGDYWMSSHLNFSFQELNISSSTQLPGNQASSAHENTIIAVALFEGKTRSHCTYAAALQDFMHVATATRSLGRELLGGQSLSCLLGTSGCPPTRSTYAVHMLYSFVGQCLATVDGSFQNITWPQQVRENFTPKFTQSG